MVRFEKEFNPIKTNVEIYTTLKKLFMPTFMDIFTKKRITEGL